MLRDSGESRGRESLASPWIQQLPQKLDVSKVHLGPAKYNGRTPRSWARWRRRNPFDYSGHHINGEGIPREFAL